MQVTSIIQELLGTSIHKARINTLSVLIQGVIKGKELKLTSLGRHLETNGTEKSAIGRVNRALSNDFFQSSSIEIYRCITRKAIINVLLPIVIVDWSSIPGSNLGPSGEHCILRASLAAEGRSITLYEEIYPKAKEGNHQVHKSFLKNLKSLFPANSRPCIVTDAGFKNPWFKAVLALGWDYIGRISGATHFNDGNGFRPLSELATRANPKPTEIGEVELAKTNPLLTRLYLYKGPSKGRHHYSKTGKIVRSKQSRKHAKSNTQPWNLVSSLGGEQVEERIIKIYKLRMTIEESFRDTKSQRYGFGLNENVTIDPRRYNVWLVISALASFIAWIVGFAAERLNLHYAFQANTYRHRRVLSYFFLGCQIIRKKIDIPIIILDMKGIAWGLSG